MKSPEIVVWAIPLAPLSISFAWCPKIFKIAIEPSEDQPPPGHNQSINESAQVDLSGVHVTLPQGQTILGVATSSNSARGKAAVITSLWKLFLIPFVAALFCYVYKTADLGNLSRGFSDFSDKHSAFPYFMVQIVTSFFGYMLGILACSMCMQLLAFAFPMTLATPITIAMAVINNGQDGVLHFSNSNPKEILLYVIVACFLFAQFLSVGYYLFKGQDFIMAKESSLFWMPTYNGMELLPATCCYLSSLYGNGLESFLIVFQFVRLPCTSTCIKRPSHGKFKFANSCWQTSKSWQTRAFTCQTHVKSQQTLSFQNVVQWHSQRVAACVLSCCMLIAKEEKESTGIL